VPLAPSGTTTVMSPLEAGSVWFQPVVAVSCNVYVPGATDENEKLPFPSDIVLDTTLAPCLSWIVKPGVPPSAACLTPSLLLSLYLRPLIVADPKATESVAPHAA